MINTDLGEGKIFNGLYSWIVQGRYGFSHSLTWSYRQSHQILFCLSSHRSVASKTLFPDMLKRVTGWLLVALRTIYSPVDIKWERGRAFPAKVLSKTNPWNSYLKTSKYNTAWFISNSFNLHWGRGKTFRNLWGDMDAWLSQAWS